VFLIQVVERTVPAVFRNHWKNKLILMFSKMTEVNFVERIHLPENLIAWAQPMFWPIVTSIEELAHTWGT